MMRKLMFAFVGVFSLLSANREATAQNTINDGLKNLELEKYGIAAKTFKDLASQKPTGENRYYLGNYYLIVEELDSAKMQFDQGITADPKYPLNYVGLGSYLMSQGKKAEAQAQFAKAKEMSKSKNADVFYRIAEAYVAYKTTNDPMEAINHGQQALKLDPKKAEAYIPMGDAALLKLDGTTAANNYDRAVSLNPGLLRAYLREGDLLIRSKSYTYARDEYNKAVAADANYAPAYRKLADLFYLAKQYDKALESMEKYVALADKSPRTQFRYAGFLILVGKHQQALDILATLKSKYDNNFIYNRLMGYASYETNQCPQGLEYLNKFFTLAKKESVAGSDYEYLGKLQMCTGGDTAKAIANLVEGVKIDSNRVSGLRDIAQKLYDEKKFARAAEVAQVYINQSGASAGANDYFLLGRAYYFAKDYTKSDAVFVQVTKILAEKDTANPLGYLWEAKSKARQDVNSEGLAEANYTKYLQMAEAETDAAKKQGYKNEMINAYNYMAILNLKKYKSLAKAHEYANKIIALDPANANAKYVLGFQQKDLDPRPAQTQTAPKKPASAKPQPKTSGTTSKPAAPKKG